MSENSPLNEAPLGEKAEGPSDSLLTSRVDRYRVEVEKIVREIGEHPLYELKRSYALSTLAQRIEFIKDIQSIATSKIHAEKFIIVGADEQSRTFVPVTNEADFDEARIRQQLDKYLAPVPQFEIFKLKTSDEIPFVLIVIPQQKTRRILATKTVDDPTEQKPRLLLREGDLWTKGESTGKRLARLEDWDAVYEDAIERETELRTRTRTDHVVQQVIAQERIKALSGGSFVLPAYLTDEELKAIVEEICAKADAGRLKILLERLRDDLIEGWYGLGVHHDDLFQTNFRPVDDFRRHVKNHRDNVFKPAMRRLTVVCIGIIKLSGPKQFLDDALGLVEETFSVSHRLHALKLVTDRNAQSDSAEGHISHTSVALESLLAIFTIGAYVAKRRRFEYMAQVLRVSGYVAGADVNKKKQPLAMWPLLPTYGAPNELRFRAGRLDLATANVSKDKTTLGYFGNDRSVRTALIEFELIVEVNSFLAVDTANAPTTSKYMAARYPDVTFDYWPSLVAFNFAHLMDIASEVFDLIQDEKKGELSKLLYDSGEASTFVADGRKSFLKLLRNLESEHASLAMELRRFPEKVYWPENIKEGFKNLSRD